eukprot:CAMPEP_0170499694 /NCGR_PEP_ID=MMETSP0208-20121228/32245_1 /TAXON_ID=197538 /ORGANISM="Strombidium inclinatum, Strain S3" /LENGTH=75 /DNA_ID=CAMNT_0010777359 /DNA_START=93 /DNA_END=320 /DNA_ORIENTATION=+
MTKEQTTFVRLLILRASADKKEGLIKYLKEEFGTNDEKVLFSNIGNVLFNHEDDYKQDPKKSVFQKIEKRFYKNL